MSVNEVVLVGRIGRDAEVRKTKDGKSVCDFSVAVEENEKTTWIPCVAWNQSADFLGRYVKKGTLLSVIGSVQARTVDRGGFKYTEAKVLVRRVESLSKKETAKEPTKSAGMDEFMQAYREVKDEEEIPW